MMSPSNSPEILVDALSVGISKTLFPHLFKVAETPAKPINHSEPNILTEPNHNLEQNVISEPDQNPESKAIKRPLSPITPPQSSSAKKRDHSYNTRARTKTKHSRIPRYNGKKQPFVFDGLLPVNNLCGYHPYKSDEAKELILGTRDTRPSQATCFEDESGEFILLSWLATVRIFRYDASENCYCEFKRIPQRYIDITPNIITCLHYCDGRIYIAYLWGKRDRRPFIEMRDTDGKLVNEILFLPEGDAADSIHSDHDFIYIKTTSGLLYIHRKEYFGSINYCVDFNSDIARSVRSTWVDQPTFESYSGLPLVSATKSEILMTRYDVLGHRLMHCYRFKDDYDIVSITKIDHLYIIHRKLNHRSRIDFGYLERSVKNLGDTVFIRESSLQFADTSNIIQIKAHKGHLYVCGCITSQDTGTIYEIGCIFIPNLMPLWVDQLAEFDRNIIILPHSRGIGLISSQKVTHIPVPSDRHDCKACGFALSSKEKLKEHQKTHKSILSDIFITQNSLLMERGASIFRKLYPIENLN